MARPKTASCHAKATMDLGLVEAAVASEKPLATFQVGRGLHQTPVSFFLAAMLPLLHNYYTLPVYHSLLTCSPGRTRLRHG